MKRFKKIKIFVFIVIFLVILFFLLNIFYKYKLDDIESLKIFDIRWKLIYDVRNDDWRKSSFKSLDDVPDFIRKIVIYREDKRFYDHNWVDLFALARAFYNDTISVSFKQWWSTIDQQSIKLSQNAFTRSISQKLKEIFLAINLNFHYSKDEILLYYINNLPFWRWIRWFASACKIYYGLSCDKLSKWEMIYLFSLSKYWVLRNVSKQSYKLAQAFWEKDYNLTDFDDYRKKIWFYVTNKAPYYVEFLMNKLGNLTDKFIYTYFDLDLYEDIDDILNWLRNYFRAESVWDVCVLILDKDGHILTMNLLKKYWDFQWWYINLCTTSRQLWSTMKPFLYVKAFDQLWLKETDTIIDEPVSYFLDNWWKYEPKNFDLKYHGKVLIWEALWSSLNIPAVKLLNDIGLDTYRDFLKSIWDMVWTTEPWDDDFSSFWLSLALWTKELTPLDFARMRKIFIFDQKNRSNMTDKEKIFYWKYWDDLRHIRNILSNNNYRLISFEQNNWLDIAWTFSKTWTSRHFIDWWTCWWVLDKIICVWTGNYDNRPITASWVDSAWVVWNRVVKLLKK